MPGAFEGFDIPDFDAPSQGGRSNVPSFEELERARMVAESRKKEVPTTVAGQVEDVAKSAGSGLERGLVSVPGLPGDIGQLYARSPAMGAWLYQNYLQNVGKAAPGSAKQAFEAKTAEIEKSMKPSERAGLTGNVFGYQLPTGRGVVEAASPYVPGITYEPQTRAGRIAGTVGEFVGSMPAFEGAGMAIKGVSKGAGAATEGLGKALATNVGAGIGAGVAQEAFPDSAAAGVVGAVPGALIGRGAFGRLSSAAAEERGARLAGDILRKTTPDVAAATKELTPPKSYFAGMEPYVQGVEPTSEQLLKSRPEVRGLSAELQALGGPESAKTAFKVGQSQEALARQAGQVPGMLAAEAPGPSMAQVLNLPIGPNPMATSSVDAHNLYRAIQKPAFDAQEQIWKHPVFSQARYGRGTVSDVLNQADAAMGISREGLPGELKNYLEGLRNYPSSQIPFDEIQKVKSYANKMIRDPRVYDKSGPIAITTKLDEMLTDPNRVIKTYMSGANASQTPQVFDQARRLTREYHNTFSTDVTKGLSEEYPAGHARSGQTVVEPEQMLDKIFGSPATALSKYRELQNIPGVNINRPASDWLIGKLTNNGQKAIVTQNDVAKFLQNPSYSQLATEIPGLRDRLNAIVKQSASDQIQTSFVNALNSDRPEKLAQFIKANRSDLRAALPTTQQQMFINQLERSSNLLAKMPTGMMADRQMFDRLAKGDLFTILHGVKTGTFAKGASGAAAGKLIGMSAPIGASFELLGASASMMGLTKPTEVAARLVYGTTKDNAMRILNEAMRNPDVYRALLQKPTIENTMRLQDLLKTMATSPELGALPTVRGARGKLQTKEQEETTEEAYQRLQRRGRASGGRLTGVTTASMLVAAAERAKKGHGKATEPLLNQPDEAITRALAIANQHS